MSTENPYTQPPPPPPAPPAPPPVQAQAVTKPPVWPTVIGWISIAVGGLFLATGLWGLATANTKITGPDGQDMMASLPDWVRTTQIASGVLALALNGCLVAGGVCLLKRLPIARTLHVVYILLAVVGAVLGLALALAVSSAVLEAAGGNAPAGAEGIMKISMIVGGVIGMLVALAYPIFLTIWLSRKKVREDIRAWSAT